MQLLFSFLFPFFWSTPDNKAKTKRGGRKKKGLLDEVQAAAPVTAREATAPGPKVMHHGRPRGEAVVERK